MHTLEVRGGDSCKLIGYVDVPDHMAEAGKVLVATRVWTPPRDERQAEAPVEQRAPVNFPIMQLVCGFGIKPLVVVAGNHSISQCCALLGPWNFRTAAQ